MKVVTSPLHTICLYPPGNITGTHFCWRLSQPQGHIVAGRIMSMKNSSDAIGNWTYDLLACSSFTEQSALLRTPSKDCTGVWMFQNVVLWRQLLLIWGNVIVLLAVNLTLVVAQALRIDNIAIGTFLCLHLSLQGYLEILICIINYDHARGHDVRCIFEPFHILYFI